MEFREVTSKIQPGCHKEKGNLKRAGLQQGRINIFQINEVFFSSSSEMEKCWREGVHVELLQLGLSMASSASAVNVLSVLLEECCESYYAPQNRARL